MNTRGLRVGARVQNIFTTTKIAALGGSDTAGFRVRDPSGGYANFSNFWRNASFSGLHKYQAAENTVWVSVVTLVGLAMVGALFSSSAWTNVTYIASEVRNPRRNLPLALILGTGIVTALYVLANLAYLNVLPLAGTPDAASVLARGLQFAAGDRVGTAVAEAIVGASGAVLVAIAVMISTFGCNNGLILAGARVYYAMAKDGLFFRSVGSVNRHNTPAVALWSQCAWACVFVPLGHVRAITRLSGFRRGDVLHADDRRTFCFALPTAEYGAALSSIRLSSATSDLSVARRNHRSAIVALQAAIHLAGINHYLIGRSGLLAVAEVTERAIAKGSREADLAARIVAC